MRRREPAEVESAGHESFLDVVTNIVCILIILVMIVGQRAHDMVVSESKTPAGPPPAAIDAQRTAAALEEDVNHLSHEIATIRQTAAARFMERDRLSTMLAAADHELAQRRALLDDNSRQKYDLDRDKALAQADLDRMESELKQLAASAETTVKIESFPTPISKVVDEKEAHFQLRHGRIAYVPFTEFAGKFHSIMEQKAHKLRDTDEITETFGPLFDFTIRYTLARVDIPWEDAVKSGQGGSYIQLASFYFYPVSSEIGEPVADAMSKTSFFRGKLEECNPKHYTITFWIFPDSFDDFNRVRRELYELGYAVAARPMPEGRRIGGAPNGSKSNAQ
ncbi:MAG TPA: hypothetical protein VHY91_11150 [Pirellulales bacterium]|jgi:hypothetical protein|nr:hypothetical protein [Pirellulales bacterium]